jgi:hypothetical protein
MNMSPVLIRAPRTRAEDMPEPANNRVAVPTPVLASPKRDSAPGANTCGQTKNAPPHAFEKDMA